jgi:tetratricopeptide (TPR) repeat protein/precorrin-2 methylase
MSRPASAALTLVGTGVDAGRDLTLDAVAALADCDVALAVGLDETALARVRKVAREVLVFPRRGDPRAENALSRELAKGRRVAWVGPGHPAECAPPPAARGGAQTRSAKGLCSLDSRLVAAREILAFGPAYYSPDGDERAAPAAAERPDSSLLARADWPASAAARARAARRLVAEGRRLLERGDADAAVRVLDDAALMDNSKPEVWIWLGRAQLSKGRAYESWRMFWEAKLLGAPPARVKPWLDRALEALGRPGETTSGKKRAASTAAARTAAARAGSLTEAGDLEGARAAWNEAVAADPRPENHDARAEWLSRYGLPLENIADRSEALRLAPTPARRALYAVNLLHARYHDLALKEFDRAVTTKDAPASAYHQRGLARLRSGDWRGALADAESARRLGAPPSSLLELRAEAAAASGRARKALAPAFAEAGPYEAAWLEGYAALAEGRPDPKPFERAADLAGDDARRAQIARVYGALARAWDWSAPAARTPGVVFCGLGVSPPLSATVECVAALRGCDVVFQNSSSDALGPLLRLLCRDIRPSSFRHEYGGLRLVEAVFAEARRGRSVGLVTFGHPLLFGPLARLALARSRREAAPLRFVAAPSSLGEMLSAGSRLGPVPRFQVLVGLAEDSAGAAARVDPGAPLLLYPEELRAASGAPRMLEVLAARYPEGHLALVLAPEAEDWDRSSWASLRDVANLPGLSLKQRLVYVPAVSAAKK